MHAFTLQYPRYNRFVKSTLFISCTYKCYNNTKSSDLSACSVHVQVATTKARLSQILIAPWLGLIRLSPHAAYVTERRLHTFDVPLVLRERISSFLLQIMPEGTNIASLGCSASCQTVFPSFYTTCLATSPDVAYDVTVYNFNQRCLHLPELSPNYCDTNNCGQCTQNSKMAVIAACNVCYIVVVWLLLSYVTYVIFMHHIFLSEIFPLCVWLQFTSGPNSGPQCSPLCSSWLPPLVSACVNVDAMFVSKAPNCNPPCTGSNCPCTGPNCGCTGPNCGVLVIWFYLVFWNLYEMLLSLTIRHRTISFIVSCLSVSR